MIYFLFMFFILNGRKGQVTLFIIVGLVLVTGVLFFLFLNRSDDSFEDDFLRSSDIGAVLANINSYSNQCFEIVVERSIVNVLSQGGFFDLSGVASLDVLGFDIPFYLYDGVASVPDESVVLDSIKASIVENFDVCVDDFSVFDDFDIVLEKSESVADVDLDEGLFISLDPNVRILSEDSSFSVDSSSVFVPLDLGRLLSVANSIVLEHVDFDSGFLAISRVESVALSNSVSFDVFGFENDAIFILKDDVDSVFALMFILDVSG